MNVKLKKIIAILIVISLFQIISLPISNATTKEIVLIIDPGHGGKMTGAINEEKGLIERDLNLKIARYLRDYLKEYEGIKVIMTHDGLPSDAEMELPDRGMVARNNNADMMISLHLNDSTDKTRHGAEVYVTNNKLLPKYNEESTKFGNIVLKKLEALGLYNNGVLTRLCNDKGPKWEYSDGSIADYYAVIRYPMKGDGEDRGADLAKGEGIPGVLIEHCYMINDSNFIDSDDDLKKLAKADCDAIVEYYGLEKKNIEKEIKVNLSKTKSNMIIGNTLSIEAIVTPDNLTNKQVTWNSSDTRIATVSEKGIVTAIQEGKVTITATSKTGAKTASAEVNIHRLSENQKLKVNNLKQENEKLSKIPEKTIVNNFKKNIEISSDLDILIKNTKGELLADTEYVGTSTKVEIIERETKKLIQEYECLIYADVNGDGKISALDYAYIKNHIMDVEKITKPEQKIVADVNGDGKISALDYAYIKNHIMDVQKIELK